MQRGPRLALFGLGGLITGVLLAIGAVFFIARSPFAAERIRRYAVKWLDDRVDGTILIQRFGGASLLKGLTLQGFSIIDKKGRPFLATDSARLKYNLRTLLGGSIQLDEVELFNPRVDIEMLPGDTLWNYQIVFPDRSEGKPQQRKLIEFNRVTVHNGLVFVRMPFQPKGRIQPSDTARFVMEDINGPQFTAGIVKTFKFANVDAQIGRVIWESPIEDGKKFDVQKLSTTAYIFRDPVRISNMTGWVSTRDTVTALRMTEVAFGGSRAEVDATVTRVEGKRNLFNIIVDGRRLIFRDLQWAYPALPDSGSVVAQLAIRTQKPKGTLFYVSDARINAPGTAMRGNFGVVMGDTLYFTDVDLKASPLNLELLRKVLPGKLPVKGLLVGTVEVKGPLSSLDAKGDIKLTQPDFATPTQLTFAGIFDARSNLSATKFHADVTSLDLGVLNALRPDLNLKGVVNGRVEATGGFNDRINFAAAVQHELAGLSSRFEGSGSYSARDRMLDLRMNALPLSFDELKAAYPALENLRGEARGPINLTGLIDDLTVDAQLATGGGELKFNGKFQQAAGRRRYSGHGRLDGFQLDRLLYKVPPSTVSGNVQFDLTGTSPADARGAVSFDLTSGRFSGVDVRDAKLAARVQDGLLVVDSMRALTMLGVMSGAGSIGMTQSARGALRFAVSTDSIMPLDGASSSTPLSGSIAANGTLVGGLGGLELEATANVRSFLYGGVAVKKSLVRIYSRDLTTDSMQVQLSAALDSAVVMGEAIDTAHADFTYKQGAGQFALNAGNGELGYRLGGKLQRDSVATTVNVEEMRLGTTDAPWVLTRPFSVRMNGIDLVADTFALEQSAHGGSIAGAGRLAWSRVHKDSLKSARQALDFGLTVRSLPFGEFLHVVGAEHSITGSTDGAIRITGTAGEPIVQADATVTDLRYAGAHIDVASGSFAYADRRAHARIDMKDGGRAIMFGDGTIPLNLAFVPITERKLKDPLEFSFRADSMPAALLAGTIGGFDQVKGWVGGTLQLHGTTVDPSMAGLLTLNDGSGIYQASGVRYRDVNGTFRVLNDSLVGVEANARTAEGSAVLNGQLNFAHLTNPKFDSLVVDAVQFQTANRRDAEFTTTGRVILTGTYQRPVLSGAIRVDGGALNLDELYRQYLVVDLDRALLFDVVDTTIVANRKLLPSNYERSPFIKNLTVGGPGREFNVDVQRNAWLRSRNLNVEVSGQLKLNYIPCLDAKASAVCTDNNQVDLRITGELSAVRGTYTMTSGLGAIQRRFDIREGTVDFPGTPGMDPILSFTASHRARPLQGEVMDIIAVVSGTLQNPRIRLTSAEGQPQMSESDLASYLFFGVPTTMLNAAQVRSLNGVGGVGAVGYVGLNAVRTSTFGYLSTGLETFAQSLGIADYVSLSAVDVGPGARAPGLNVGQFFTNSRLEVGRYVNARNQDFFFIVSKPLYSAANGWGGRVEWRFDPTYTLEFFAEDRNARAATTLGIEQTSSFARVYGFFFFREWGR